MKDASEVRQFMECMTLIVAEKECEKRKRLGIEDDR